MGTAENRGLRRPNADTISSSDHCPSAFYEKFTINVICTCIALRTHLLFVHTLLQKEHFRMLMPWFRYYSPLAACLHPARQANHEWLVTWPPFDAQASCDPAHLREISFHIRRVLKAQFLLLPFCVTAAIAFHQCIKGAGSRSHLAPSYAAHLHNSWNRPHSRVSWTKFDRKPSRHVQ